MLSLNTLLLQTTTYFFHLFVSRFGCSKPECSIISPGFVHPSDVFVSSLPFKAHKTPSWFNWGYTPEPANCFIKNNTGSIEPIFKSHNEGSETENITVFYWKCFKPNAWTQRTWTWWASSVSCWRTLRTHDRDHMECVIRQRSGWTDGVHHISVQKKQGAGQTSRLGLEPDLKELHGNLTERRVHKRQSKSASADSVLSHHKSDF